MLWVRLDRRVDCCVVYSSPEFLPLCAHANLDFFRSRFSCTKCGTAWYGGLLSVTSSNQDTEKGKRESLGLIWKFPISADITSVSEEQRRSGIFRENSKLVVKMCERFTKPFVLGWYRKLFLVERSLLQRNLCNVSHG